MLILHNVLVSSNNKNIYQYQNKKMSEISFTKVSDEYMNARLVFIETEQSWVHKIWNTIKYTYWVSPLGRWHDRTFYELLKRVSASVKERYSPS